MTNSKKATLNRRTLLRTLALGAGAAAASTGPLVASMPKDAGEPSAKSGGYRETAHIRTFYRVSRYSGGDHHAH